MRSNGRAGATLLNLLLAAVVFSTAGGFANAPVFNAFHGLASTSKYDGLHRVGIPLINDNKSSASQISKTSAPAHLNHARFRSFEFSPALPGSRSLQRQSNILEMSGGSSSSSSRSRPAIKRDIVLVCHQISDAAARGDFNPNNLLEGRIDVLCRCISAALYISNGIRADTRVWLVLGASGITVQVDGNQVQGLNPDEKTIALMLQRCLELRDFSSMQQLVNFHIGNLLGETAGAPSSPISHASPPKPSPAKLQKSTRNLEQAERARQRRLMAKAARGIADPNSDAPLEPPPGFRMHRNETLFTRLALLMASTDLDEAAAAHSTSSSLRTTRSEPQSAPPRVLMMHEEGEPVSKALGFREIGAGLKGGSEELGRVVLIVGDAIGFTPDEEAQLEAMPEVKRVSLGRKALLASHCIVLAHHYLDAHEEEAETRPEESAKGVAR